MKKIVIILSVILVFGTFCFGQDSKSPAADNKTIKLQNSADITLLYTKNSDWTAQSSNNANAVIKIDSIIYKSDSLQAIVYVTGIDYNHVNSRSVSSLMLIKQIPDFVSYILAALLIGLSVLFFIINKKRNTKLAYYRKRKAYYKSLANSAKRAKDNESDEEGDLSPEIEQSTNENQALRTENSPIRQNREESEKPELQNPIVSPPPPQALYADAIIDGKFNRVREQPDEDTVFELKLNPPGGSSARVIIYSPAYRRIIANPSFLEGCEKQIVGGATVTMLREGVAQKDDSGKWNITTTLRVKIG